MISKGSTGIEGLPCNSILMSLLFYLSLTIKSAIISSLKYKKIDKMFLKSYLTKLKS